MVMTSSTYPTLNPSPLRVWCWHHSQSVRTLNSSDRKSCHIPDLLDRVLFSRAAHFQVLQHQSSQRRWKLGYIVYEFYFIPAEPSLWQVAKCWHCQIPGLSTMMMKICGTRAVCTSSLILSLFFLFWFNLHLHLNLHSHQLQKLFNDDENMWHQGTQ